MKYFGSIINGFKTLNFIWRHPLNKNNRLGSILRYVRWQFGSRILKLPVLIPLLDNVYVYAIPGMTGITGNLYCGLDEYEDMSLILHALKKEDLFIDVGANEGTYTLLASGGVGSDVIAFEPLPVVFKRLERNIRLNDLNRRVKLFEIALGSKETIIRFSSNDDTKDHVLTDGEMHCGHINVNMQTMDVILQNMNPKIIKIDVEGFEYDVLSGASNVLRNNALLALIIETNKLGNRYGYNTTMINDLMNNYGFFPYRYNPFKKTFTRIYNNDYSRSNTLFIRDIQTMSERVKVSQQYHLANGMIL